MSATQHSILHLPLPLLALAVVLPAPSQAAESAPQPFATPFSEPGQVIVAPPGELGEQDRIFIQQAASYHRGQVQAAERMLARTDTQAVQDYARRLDYDQASAYAKLREVAAMHRIALPELGQASGDSGRGDSGRTADADAAAAKRTDDKPDGAAVKKDGQKTDSSAPDNASLLRESIHRHLSELARFEQERKQSKAPNLNAYIEATTPVIEEHLKLARRLLSAVSAVGVEQTPVERGRYLARVGDCESCHTREGGEPYAGGRALKTPYGGVIYSANITPSPEGIGTFTDEDFLTALHEGLSPDGEPYYPAFPYPSFTKVNDEDALAIKAYLDTIKPSDDVPPKPALPWPLGIRDSLYAWQELFFEPG